MTELVFEVTQEADGGYCAECLTFDIFTQAATWDELRTNVREAVRAYFFDGAVPGQIRLHLMPSRKKLVPEFKSEEEERNFWSAADSTEYVDWTHAKRRKLVQLKPTLRTISLRLPVSMIEDLKVFANRRDVPYQSLLKVFLAERLELERRRRTH